MVVPQGAPMRLQGICFEPPQPATRQSVKSGDHRTLQPFRRNYKAGTNPYLRLSLCDSPMADPGCWLLHNTVTTFRRLARKEPLLVQQWGLFHSSFAGSLLAGPFSQLLHVLNQVDWRVETPFVFDHDNCRHHLLSLPSAALVDLLTDAWYQYIAQRAPHRKIMTDLAGLDSKLVQR